MYDIIARHRKIAFQFSGGRDSLAALYAMRPWWSKLAVYHLDAGEQFPEVKEVVQRAAAELPRFVMVHGRRAETEAEFGYPSDLLPTQCHSPLGRMVSGSQIALLDRYECCYRSVMVPMQERMAADGVTLVIRGQRDSDYQKQPLRSGAIVDGVEYFYPLEDWSDADVDDYLASSGIEPAPFYRHGLTTTPECMTCSAWWDDRRGAYLEKFHPEAHGKYMGKLILIHREISKQMQELHAELGLASRPA